MISSMSDPMPHRSTSTTLIALLSLLLTGCGRSANDAADPKANSADRDASKPFTTGINAWPLHRGDAALTGSANTAFPTQWRIEWSRTTADSPVTGVAVSDGSIFVAHANGGILRLPLDGGEPLWRTVLEADVDAPISVLDGLAALGTLDGEMVALHMADGSVAWRYATEDAIHGAANFATAPDGTRRVVFGSYDTNLYALDSATGTLAWRHATNNYVNGTPALVDGGVVASGCDGRVRRLNAADGTEAFATAASSYVPGSPTVAHGLAVAVGHDGTVAAVDVTDGTITWRIEPGESRDTVVLSPGTNGECVILASENGGVICRSLEDGAQRWRVKLPSPPTTAPLLGRRTVFLGTADGTVEQLSLADGTPVSSTTIGTAISCDLAVTPTGLLVGTDQGLLLHLTPAH